MPAFAGMTPFDGRMMVSQRLNPSYDAAGFMVSICQRLPEGTLVKEIMRTNDTVLVSAVEALLDSAGIGHLVLDQNMSVLEGSLGILPRRVLVADEEVKSARQLLVDAGLGGELRPDAGG
jgi:DNA-binding MltR family transcriptional regulator